MDEGAINALLQRISHLRATDPQFQAAQPDLAVARSITAPGVSLHELIDTVCTNYADRPALGERQVRLVRDQQSGRTTVQFDRGFHTISYGQLWTRACAVSQTLADRGVEAGARIAILGAPGIEHTIVDVAVALTGTVSVPLHTATPLDVLHPIVEQTAPTVICSSAEYLADTLELCRRSETVTTVLVFGDHPGVDEHDEAIDEARRTLSGVYVASVHDLATRSTNSPATFDGSDGPDRLALVMFTSGSGGAPKGAMYPERLVAASWTQAAGMMAQTGFAVPALTLNYLPMSHTGGRSMLYATLGVGGTAYFTARSDLSALLVDVSLVRPTQLNFVPRVWDLLHSEYRRELARRSGNLSGEDRVESEAMAYIRERVLGGRYISALTGSAPIAPGLKSWVESLLGVHVIDGFGATESGPVIVDGRVQRPPVTEYKLLDVPELGYLSSDRPHPRGELAIKSETLFSGYYGRPDLTAEVFDAAGFYRTGDIVAEVGVDQLVYVDRRNSVVKLAQGEFIAISKLETIFAKSDLIDQVFVYGDSTQPYLLAVIVPASDASARFEPAELKSAIAGELRVAAQHANLQSYEVPRDFIIERESFTVENGLLTGVGKLRRPVLTDRYRERLDQLYLDIANAEDAELHDLRVHGAEHPPAETIPRVVAALLGSVGSVPDPRNHFTDLGGDSLSALTFANLINEVYGVELPVSQIVSPLNDLSALARYVEAERSGADGRVTATSLHGHDADELHADDLTLSAFIDAPTLRSAPESASSVRDVRSVLLTGGNGFLGRYLTIAWLERMRAVGGRLTCVVRAADDESAYVRLETGFDTGDEGLLAHFRELATDHLDVVAGDKTQRQLGMTSAVWSRLSEDVDTIVDAAAMVNHLLPYRELFAPNVSGTAELVRLALTERRKRFAYVSTIGVGAAMQPGDFTELADIRAASPRRSNDDTYANGYANSKWAAEVLLRDANETHGLPVAVFRCGMLVAAHGYAGQLNLPDTLTRLLFSVIVTGLAPASFYQTDAEGNRQRAHFDGLAVDFASQAIVELTARGCSGHSTYHVLNPHDDGIGLDQYVDWLVDGGCRIERIADYETWYSHFHSALTNLPERQKALSVLPLLQTYRHPQLPMRGTFAPTDRFRDAVRHARIGRSGDIPQVRAADILKYATDFELLGLMASK